MRVAVIGPTYADSFAANITFCLARMDGVEVESVGPIYPYRQSRAVKKATSLAEGVGRLNDRLQAAVVARALAFRPDLVITVDARLAPAAVSRIRRAGAAVVLWFPDHLSNLGRQLMFLGDYSAVFFKEPHIVERAGAMLDCPVFYLPEACNPAWHFPTENERFEDEVVVAGNMYPWRQRLVERLVDAEVPVRIYGPPWAPWVGGHLRPYFANQYIATTTKARTFRMSIAVLNAMHPAEFRGVNCRLFEAAGCGAAVVTEHREVLPDLFDAGREVLVFRTFDELVDQLRWLRGHRDEGRAIGDRGAKRAHAEHTYQHRLAALLEDVATLGVRGG